MEIGPLYGYFPNGSKTQVLAKPRHVEAAKEIFKGTGIVILAESDTWVEQLGLACSYINCFKEKWNAG